MITNRLKSKIDALWLDFHSGGITNPITVIEQISYLMFARLLDLSEARNESRAKKLNKPFEGIFPPDKQNIRWSNFQHLGGDQMLQVVRDQFFPFMRTELEKKTALGRFLKDANCLIPNGNLLVRAVTSVEDLPLTEGDTKGDLYEYLLSKLSTAGIAGQFRTPRHIIKAMVQMIDPLPTERCCDPAAGTAGFLVGVMEYLKEKYSSPGLIEEQRDDDGKVTKHYPGDLLEDYRQHIQTDMLHGFEFDHTMLRIAAMNLLLHGIEAPCIQYQDTLDARFADKLSHESAGAFDVIMANPPFKSSIDLDGVDPKLRSVVKTKKSELLFIVRILQMLKQGGRAAVIVPDGVLFGSSAAHVSVRKLLIDENQLEAVISLPSGVFRPYAGVITAILLFSKGATTRDVWFYEVEGDGFTLDDKRAPQAEKNDLPDMLDKWSSRDAKIKQDRTGKSFFVPASDIRSRNYDLSQDSYKDLTIKVAKHTEPSLLLGNLKSIESEIQVGLERLSQLLKP